MRRWISTAHLLPKLRPFLESKCFHVCRDAGRLRRLYSYALPRWHCSEPIIHASAVPLAAYVTTTAQAEQAGRPWRSR